MKPFGAHQSLDLDEIFLFCILKVAFASFWSQRCVTSCARDGSQAQDPYKGCQAEPSKGVFETTVPHTKPFGAHQSLDLDEISLFRILKVAYASYFDL